MGRWKWREERRPVLVWALFEHSGRPALEMDGIGVQRPRCQFGMVCLTVWPFRQQGFRVVRASKSISTAPRNIYTRHPIAWSANQSAPCHAVRQHRLEGQADRGRHQRLDGVDRFMFSSKRRRAPAFNLYPLRHVSRPAHGRADFHCMIPILPDPQDDDHDPLDHIVLNGLCNMFPEPMQLPEKASRRPVLVRGEALGTHGVGADGRV